MKNSIDAVGRKIREVRSERGMTQKELCGDDITRNHLSMIESGKALPSIGTLCTIADRLDVPVGYLLSADESDDAKFAELFASESIRSVYASGDYRKVISMCDSLPRYCVGDEIALMEATSAYNEALAASERLELGVARRLFERAKNTARSCCYLGDDILSAIDYRLLMNETLFDESISGEMTDLSASSSYIPIELILYMRMLGDLPCDGLHGVHLCHAEARSLIKEDRLDEAFERLLSLGDITELPYYMRYRVSDTVQRCAELSGKYETAYSAAKQKLELMNMTKSDVYESEV